MNIAKKLPSQFEVVPQFISVVIDRLKKEFPINEDEIFQIKLALEESLINAIKHGNKLNPDLTVDVAVTSQENRLTITVQDQGEGFDYNHYLRAGQGGDAVGAARQRYAQGRLGGLGIMLMLRSVDKLEYFGSGNQVALTKYVKKRAATKTAIPTLNK